MKYITQDWTSTKDGYLFFVQRLQEMLFHYSDDIVKAPVHNTQTLLEEYVDTEKDVVKGSIKQYQLDIIAKEIKSSLMTDVIVRELYKYEVIEEMAKFLDKDQRTAVHYIFNKIPKKKYYEICCKYLKENLSESNRKTEIEKGLRAWLAFLLWHGYSSEYIYRFLRNIFEESINDPEKKAQIFLNRFDFEIGKYKVYFVSDCRQSPAFAGFCYCWNRFSDIINIRRAVFFMMTKNTDKKREQMMMFSMDDMVPQNHMLRLIDKAINWNFIYDLVEEKYCPDNGRPSMDPVMLIKIPFIQYLYGIKSMRQTMKEIEVNVAYRWFLGLDMLDPVPHFSTFGKNYTRRFKDTDLFEQIFSKILEDCMKYKLVNTEQIFVDATHVKACANSKKMRKRVAHEQALWYEEELNKEIEKDRLAHGKKPLKKKDDNQPPASGGTGNDKDSISEELPEDVKTQKCSISDPESGWFRKGEHKHVFAYAVETACDKHGWILGYTVHPGNEHDSRTFKALYDKISKLNPQMVVADAGYKTPAIAHRLLEDGIQPLFPYTRPKTKEGFFGKHEFAYDEYYDCYICPGAHILAYSTTNRSGYKEYKSCGEHCAECQCLSKCTESKDHVKLITRHVWEEYMEVVEDIRHTIGNRQIYQLRKETIERIFGTAKEQHGFRYTQYVGKARMEMKAGLTFACMNLKKLAKILEKRGWNTARFLLVLKKIKRKEVLKEKWCWA